MLAPSEQQEQRRFQQLASMRGMSLEDVARAEGGPRARMPEPAASINFAALQKEDKTQWPEKLKALETRYTDIAFARGENSPEAVKAKNELESYRSLTLNVTSDQFDHAKTLSKARAILVDKTLNVSPEVRKWAEGVEKEELARQLRLKASGEKDDKIPSDTALINIARIGAGNYLRRQYVGNKDFANIPVKDEQGNIIGEKFTYKGDKPELERALIAEEQRGVIAAMQPYMVNGRAINRGVASVLTGTFGIKLDENQRPIMPDTPPPSFEAPKPAGDSRATVKPPASYVAPAPATAPGPGRAGQGAPMPSTVAEGTRAKSKSGKDMIYRNGQWEYL